ncbi:MAG TPA: YdcH family protein [Dongiaceae bacterium]
MALTSHLESLKAKHSDLEARIADEERRPHPDETSISDLKKQKLRIKDELTQLVRLN